jgi:hypothetical protein
MQDLSGILMDIHTNPLGKTTEEITTSIQSFYQRWKIIELQDEFGWDGNFPAPSTPDYTVYGYIKKLF